MAPELYDMCDRMGFLVMDEAFDEWTRGKKKWVTGHNVQPPGFDGYHEDFRKMGGCGYPAIWSGATAIIHPSSCGASATRLITPAILSGILPAPAGSNRECWTPTYFREWRGN